MGKQSTAKGYNEIVKAVAQVKRAFTYEAQVSNPDLRLDLAHLAHYLARTENAESRWILQAALDLADTTVGLIASQGFLNTSPLLPTERRVK